MKKILSESEFLKLAKQREHELLPCPFFGDKPSIELSYVSEYSYAPTTQSQFKYPETVILIGGISQARFYGDLTEETLDSCISTYNFRAFKPEIENLFFERMKKKKRKNGEYCPVCECFIKKGDCPFCGQRIDYSE